MKPSSSYKRQKHLNAVIACSGVHHAARHVLEVLCRISEFDRPEVTITKPQIQDETGLCPNTVRAALRALKARGLAQPIRNRKGGRGIAVTYRLTAMQDDASPAPRPAAARTIWDAVAEDFAASHPADYGAWLSRLTCTDASAPVLALEAPSRFVADHVRTHYASALLDRLRGRDAAFQRIEIGGP